MSKKGFISEPLGFTRRMVIASVRSNKKNAIHSMVEVDVTAPRKAMKEYQKQTGTKLSFTGYIVKCFAETLKKHSGLNAFIRGRKLILLEDITVSVLVEREIDGKSVPEPVAIHCAGEKSLAEITAEIRAAQSAEDNRMGGLSGTTWINLIPPLLLRLFIRIADRNIAMAKRYGKVAVTAVGMFAETPLWFIPHGTATVMLTVGSTRKHRVDAVASRNSPKETINSVEETLCLTVSFDHEVVDGAPAARFMSDLTEILRSGRLISNASHPAR